MKDSLSGVCREFVPMYVGSSSNYSYRETNNYSSIEDKR